MTTTNSTNRVIHQRHGLATIQELYKNLHPNLPDDMCYIKCDTWPVSTEGEPFEVDTILVFKDELKSV